MGMVRQASVSTFLHSSLVVSLVIMMMITVRMTTAIGNDDNNYLRCFGAGPLSNGDAGGLGGGGAHHLLLGQALLQGGEIVIIVIIVAIMINLVPG